MYQEAVLAVDADLNPLYAGTRVVHTQTGEEGNVLARGLNGDTVVWSTDDFALHYSISDQLLAYLTSS